MGFVPSRTSFISRIALAASFVTAVAFVAPAHAQTTYTGGAGFSIPDNFAGIATSTINVATSAQVTSFNSITLTNLVHTWCSDVQALLTHNGRTVQLISFYDANESSNFNGTYVLTPTATTTLEQEATLGGTNYVLRSGSYLPDQGNFSAFTGQDLAGAWTLQMYDTAAGDVGTLGSWSFNATSNTPTPPAATNRYSGGAGAAIPDADFITGAPGSVFSDIIVGDNFNISSFSSITISGLTHGYAGDLTAQLIHVDTGTTVDLFARVGKTTTNDTDLGDDSDFNGDYTFTLGGPSLLTAAGVGNTSYIIPSSPFPGGVGTYAASTSQVPGFANANTLASFAGQNVGGRWRLLLTDSTAGDTGSFTGWRFGVNATTSATAPEPGTLPLAVATLPIIGAFIRRRRSL